METGSDASHGDATLDALNDLYNLLENPRQSAEMSGPFLPYFQDQVRSWRTKMWLLTVLPIRSCT